MVADITIMAVVSVIAFIGVKRGIAVTILNILGIIVTAAAAFYLSGIISDFIYDTFLQESVTENLQQIISLNGERYAAENCLDSLPDWLQSFVSGAYGMFGAEVHGAGAAVVSSGVSIIEGIVRTAVTKVFDVVAFVILGILIYIIVKIIVHHVLKLFKLPLINGVNKFLGGILGVFEGMVLMFIAVNIFSFCVGKSDADFINNYITNGFIFNIFKI